MLIARSLSLSLYFPRVPCLYLSLPLSPYRSTLLHRLCRHSKYSPHRLPLSLSPRSLCRRLWAAAAYLPHDPTLSYTRRPVRARHCELAPACASLTFCRVVSRGRYPRGSILPRSLSRRASPPLAVALSRSLALDADDATTASWQVHSCSVRTDDYGLWPCHTWELKVWYNNFEDLLFSCILICWTRICFYCWPITQAFVPNLKKVPKQQFSFVRVERLIKEFWTIIILIYFDLLNTNLLLFLVRPQAFVPKLNKKCQNNNFHALESKGLKKIWRTIILMYFDLLNTNLLLFLAHHPSVCP